MISSKSKNTDFTVTALPLEVCICQKYTLLPSSVSLSSVNTCSLLVILSINVSPLLLPYMFCPTEKMNCSHTCAEKEQT